MNIRRWIANYLDCWSHALRLASELIYVEPAPVCAPTVQDVLDMITAEDFQPSRYDWPDQSPLHPDSGDGPFNPIQR